MALTRNLAVRCLSNVKDVTSRKLLQQAVAKETVLYVNEEMEAALRLNVVEADDDDIPSYENQVPCHDCGNLISEITAERTGGFCVS